MEEFATLCRNHEAYRPHLIYETYKTAQIIHMPGDPIERIGIVVKGILKAENVSAKGQELCHAYFDAEEIFPEFLYFAGDRHYTYSLVAVHRTTVAWLPILVFEDMLEEPRMMRALLLYISKRGLKNQMLLSCLNYQTIRERVAYWLVSMNNLSCGEEIALPSSQTIWANTLRVSRSSLNQELKRMEREGHFTLGPGTVRILNRQSLEELL